MKKWPRALVGLVLAALTTVAVVAASKGFTIEPNYTQETLVNVSFDAKIDTQVVPVMVPGELPRLVVIVRRPGDVDAEIRFYNIRTTLPPVPPPGPQQPVPGDVLCPPSFVPTIATGGCVPLNHPLARKQ